jgi:single-strand DNA-binding protein
MNMNSWTGCGRLTRDAEFSHTTGKGTAMSKFRLAINSYRQGEEQTMFMNILCFGKLAENLNDKLLKGRLVAIKGPLKIDEYEDTEQNHRTSVCVMADEISLGPPPSRITERNDTGFQ